MMFPAKRNSVVISTTMSTSLGAMPTVATTTTTVGTTTSTASIITMERANRSVQASNRGSQSRTIILCRANRMNRRILNPSKYLADCRDVFPRKNLRTSGSMFRIKSREKFSNLEFLSVLSSSLQISGQRLIDIEFVPHTLKDRKVLFN
ncbi:hypothetical protein CsSME_00043168 [Camellia sinensis var. sinensis]